MYFYYELAGLGIREAYVRSSSRQCYQLFISWASERKAYIWCKCVDLTSDTDTDSDKTAVSAFISNGALYGKKKGFEPKFLVFKTRLLLFFFLFDS